MDDAKAVLDFIKALTESEVELFKKITYLFENINRFNVLRLLLDRGASSALAIQIELDISEASAYRLINELENLGYVKRRKIPIKIKVHSGPTPFIWYVPGADDRQVVNAWNEFKQIKADAILNSPSPDLRTEPLGVET